MALTDATTVLWPYGGPGSQYGSFAGKAQLPQVPDVTGETQAAGTATLEGEGFVVAVETAYSDSVAEGLIISQVPTGGSFAASGSTVTITVSLGIQPVDDSQPSGGWGFWALAESHRRERERRKRRLEEIEREELEIQDQQDREIARLLKVQQEADERRTELERLQSLVDRYARDERLAQQLPERVTESMQRAEQQRSREALLALQRELSLMIEEEEALAMLLLTLQ